MYLSLLWVITHCADWLAPQYCHTLLYDSWIYYTSFLLFGMFVLAGFICCVDLYLLRVDAIAVE